MTEWNAFAALAVKYLGMPVETMPLYSEDSKWSWKASRVLDFVLVTGNFGHNRDYSYKKRYPYMVIKATSLWHHTCDAADHLLVFPIDSLKAWGWMVWNGVRGAFAQKCR